MDYTIFDIEANNLLDEVTTIYCLSWYRSNGTRGTLTNIYEFGPFLEQQNILVAHNLKRYDIPVILKVIGYEVLNRVLDTLAFSWYLFPEYKVHGLEEWGERVGIAKPEITDWENLTLEEYIYRCEVDVEINRLVFEKFLWMFIRIYDGDIDRIMDYLTEKLECGAEQEEIKLKVDIEHCQKMLDILNPLIEEKMRLLNEQMPPVITYKKVTKPKNLYKKDGELNAYGSKWMELLFSLDLDANTEGPLKIIDGSRLGSSGSIPQIKKWLFSLGWIPTIYKYERIPNTRDNRAIPQLNDKDGNICEGIKNLYEEHPYLENLESLFMLKHRKITFQNFIEAADSNQFMKAEVAGFTNTLRFKHKKPIANLPKVSKPYGKEVRGAIIIPNEDSLFCGSDMDSLEDTTKQHYMFYYDPEYVTQMRTPGFSAHLDIGVQGEMITQEESDFYVWFDSKKEGNVKVTEIFEARLSDYYRSLTLEQQLLEFKRIGKIRGEAKVVNFSAVYGVGFEKMSLGTKWPQEKSKRMLDIYWDRNKAVKQVASDIFVKVFFKDTYEGVFYNGAILAAMQKHNKPLFNNIEQMWLYNPVSQFYYSLRYIKDIFSTLNQGTGVYCFDMQVRAVRKKGIKIALQYHDEIGFPFLHNNEQGIRNALQTSIKEVNQQLNLNIPLGISIDVGNNYADTH